MKDLSGVGRKGHVHPLSESDPRQFILVYICIGPDIGNIGYGVKVLAGLYVHALLDVFIHYYACHGRLDLECPHYFPCLLKFLYLVLGHVPEFQSPSAEVHKRGPSDLLHPSSHLPRKEKLFLGGDEFRAVELKEHVALLHLLPRKVKVEFFHPSVYLCMYVIDLLLVIGNPSNGPYGLLKFHAPDLCRAHAYVLNGHGVYLHCPWLQGIFLALIDRYEVHAHGRFSRLLGDI